MYNAERKTRFIESGGMEHWKYNWAESVFNSVEHTERELGMDIAEMTADDVASALATPEVISASTLVNRIPFIVRYKAWCLDQGYKALLVDTADIRVDVSGGMRDTMVYSEAHLADILQQAFPEKSENDSKCIYKAHLWLGYAGMQDLDTLRVETQDIDFNQCAVFLDNRMYFFPAEGRRDVRHAAEMQVFERIVNGKCRTFRRMEGDRILRGRLSSRPVDDKAYLMKTIRTAVHSGFDQSGHHGMSFIRIRKSGIYREAFRREIRGVPVNFYQVGHDDFVFDGRQPTQCQTKQKILRRIIVTYERDYESWKRAFSAELKEEFGLKKIPHQFAW